MRLLKRLVVFIILAIVLAFAVLFSIQNTVRVPLDLLVFQLSEQRLSLWVLLAFAAGGVTGVAISMLAIMRLKSELLLARRKHGRNEKELAKMRTAPVKS